VKYQVWVDDNFHYQDEDERYMAGEYATAEEALAVAKGMVDAFLKKEHRRGMTAEQLYNRYIDYGSDPFLRSDDPNTPKFSAWDYAKQRCQEICG